MGGGCILYPWVEDVSSTHGWRWIMYFNLPLSAPACCRVPFRLPKHRFSNSLSQHQSNSQAELSKATSDDFKISKRKRTISLSEYIPIYQSCLQCDFCIRNHLVTRPVTKGRAPHTWKNFLPPEKCLGHIVCITIVFVHAIEVKFGPPSENSSPLLVSQAGYGSAGDCCLVTSVSYATQLSLFTIKFRV